MVEMSASEPPREYHATLTIYVGLEEGGGWAGAGPGLDGGAGSLNDQFSPPPGSTTTARFGVFDQQLARSATYHLLPLPGLVCSISNWLDLPPTIYYHCQVWCVRSATGSICHLPSTTTARFGVFDQQLARSATYHLLPLPGLVCSISNWLDLPPTIYYHCQVWCVRSATGSICHLPSTTTARFGVFDQQLARSATYHLLPLPGLVCSISNWLDLPPTIYYHCQVWCVVRSATGSICYLPSTTTARFGVFDQQLARSATYHLLPLPGLVCSISNWLDLSPTIYYHCQVWCVRSATGSICHLPSTTTARFGVFDQQLARSATYHLLPLPGLVCSISNWLDLPPTIYYHCQVWCVRSATGSICHLPSTTTARFGVFDQQLARSATYHLLPLPGLVCSISNWLDLPPTIYYHCQVWCVRSATGLDLSPTIYYHCQVWCVRSATGSICHLPSTTTARFGVFDQQLARSATYHLLPLPGLVCSISNWLDLPPTIYYHCQVWCVRSATGSICHLPSTTTARFGVFDQQLARSATYHLLPLPGLVCSISNWLDLSPTYHLLPLPGLVCSISNWLDLPPTIYYHCQVWCVRSATGSICHLPSTTTARFGVFDQQLARSATYHLLPLPGLVCSISNWLDLPPTIYYHCQVWCVRSATGSVCHLPSTTTARFGVFDQQLARSATYHLLPLPGLVCSISNWLGLPPTIYYHCQVWCVRSATGSICHLPSTTTARFGVFDQQLARSATYHLLPLPGLVCSISNWLDLPPTIYYHCQVWCVRSATGSICHLPSTTTARFGVLDQQLARSATYHLLPLPGLVCSISNWLDLPPTIYYHCQVWCARSATGSICHLPATQRAKLASLLA
ncbi:hypothetical protein RRG08_061069 [Elysia crispata]|uniref:Uncharacterized protein n=1 Tax=Elysia crispata TaxID=231223 RepID=A0AAE1D5M3_9GAST|nr:hypothetical protein RRG08_061069 [Elysia crispata]